MISSIAARMRSLWCIAGIAIAGVVSHTLAAPIAPAEISAVQFGYDGILPYERWGPVRVKVQANAEAFTGRLEIRYRQDSLQSQIISVPASAAAGTTVPVEVVVNMPHDLDDVVISLFDSRGRVIDRVIHGKVGNSPVVDTQLNIDQADGVIGCIGRVSAVGAVKARWFGINPDLYAFNTQALVPNKAVDFKAIARKRSARLRAVAINAEDLSTSWAAFDALEALIVRAEDSGARVNADSRAAILQWVQAGGRLVLQVDQTGETWSQWLPSEIAEQIKIGDSIRFATPPEVVQALTEPVLIDTTEVKEYKVPQGQLPGEPKKTIDHVELADIDPTKKNTEELRAKLVAAPEMPGRTIQLSDALRQRGWTTSWESAGKHLVIQGPVGFGCVTIIGFDPALAAAIPNHEASYRLWLDVLQSPLEDWVACNDLSISTGKMYWQPIQNSGANEFQRRAISVALNKVAEAPASSFSPFIVVGGMAACTLLLAFFIGPFDAILLKRRAARQLSWMTAIGWIGLMALVALYAPRLVRGDLTSIVIRERVIDQMSGSPLWTSSATGFFSGDAGVRSLEFESPTVFFRGAGLNDGYSRVNEILAPIRCEQTDLVLDAIRTRSSIPRQIEQQQWTFRSMLEEGILPDQQRVAVKLNTTAAACVVDVSLPSAAATKQTIRSATLRIGTDDLVANLSALNSEASEAVSLTFPPLPAKANLQTDWTAYWGNITRQVAFTQSNAWSDHLPGAERRRLSIEQQLRTGKFALLTLSLVSHMADLSTSDADAKYLTGTTYRVLIPLDQSQALFRSGAHP